METLNAARLDGAPTGIPGIFADAEEESMEQKLIRLAGIAAVSLGILGLNELGRWSVQAYSGSVMECALDTLA